MKISDIKEKFIKEEKENNLLKRKKERKQNKKKKRGELLKKYQEEINKEINEEKLKNENFLVATKKVKNAEANDLNKKKKKIYKKKNMRLLLFRVSGSSFIFFNISLLFIFLGVFLLIITTLALDFSNSLI